MSSNSMKILDDASNPPYAHKGDAGMDIFSVEEATIKAEKEKHKNRRKWKCRMVLSGLLGIKAGWP